jgi:hypothetical protein
MFKRIYNFVLLFKEYAVFSLLLVVSLIFMALNDNTQIRHIRGVATVVFGVVQNQLAFVPRYFFLLKENEILRRMNVDLADEASQSITPTARIQRGFSLFPHSGKGCWEEPDASPEYTYSQRWEIGRGFARHAYCR